MSYFTHLAQNTRGRDFIVGDLHGSIDLLLARLDGLRFDPAADRLFSVGDLIDRGADCLACLRLLREPWFFAVRGNHEQMLLDCVAALAAHEPQAHAVRLFLHNGGAWLLSLSSDQEAELWQDLLPRVRALPYVISVGNAPARFNVVHAELAYAGPSGNAAALSEPSAAQLKIGPRLMRDLDLNAANLLENIPALIWGRRLVRSGWQASEPSFCSPFGRISVSEQAWHPGLSLSYCGHTILRRPRLHASHLFLDRGAFMRTPESDLLVVEHGRIWL